MFDRSAKINDPSREEELRLAYERGRRQGAMEERECIVVQIRSVIDCLVGSISARDALDAVATSLERSDR